MKAAKNPPRGMGAASFELSEGTLISARSESLATVCLEAVQRLNQDQ
jgi:hypothetical protein